MSEERKYVFFKSRGGNHTERIEKTERELTKPDKDLIYGNLVNTWNNCPESIQQKFISEFIAIVDKSVDAFEERINLDNMITDLVNHWRTDRSGQNEKLADMIDLIENNFDYVAIIVYPDAKIVVKIHDGVQEFN